MQQALLRSSALAVFALCFAQAAHANITSFTNDYAAWHAAAGATTMVDFETLPNGAASFAGAQITGNNYASQGAVFSSITNDLQINGNPIGGFGLRSGSFFGGPTNIRADLQGARHAFGIFFPGGTTLSVFDNQGNLLGTNSFSSGGDNFFMGFVSDTPIAYAISERRYGNYVSDLEYWQSATYSANVAAVPEPETYGMMLAGLGALAWVAKRRKK
ncbi:MAG: PEP-CTERM sorting domain-containing protein [Burkholderiales bacterium]|nr:PEP-CTERM sorting domain-containing protein [Burkholderiales bacterium]